MQGIRSSIASEREMAEGAQAYSGTLSYGIPSYGQLSHLTQSPSRHVSVATAAVQELQESQESSNDEAPPSLNLNNGNVIKPMKVENHRKQFCFFFSLSVLVSNICKQRVSKRVIHL